MLGWIHKQMHAQFWLPHHVEIGEKEEPSNAASGFALSPRIGVSLFIAVFVISSISSSFFKTSIPLSLAILQPLSSSSDSANFSRFEKTFFRSLLISLRFSHRFS